MAKGRILGGMVYERSNGSAIWENGGERFEVSKGKCQLAWSSRKELMSE